MDCNGCEIQAPFRIPRARIFWHAGRLYYATSKTDVRSLAMPVAPVKVGGGFQGVTDEGAKVRVRLPGCGCKKIASLIGVPVQDLIAAASITA